MNRFDPPTIFKVLAAHEVEYVLIGAMAAMLQGAGLAETADVDIAPAPAEENRTKLAAALREMAARLRIGGNEEPVAVTLDARTFKGISVMTFVTSFGPSTSCSSLPGHRVIRTSMRGERPWRFPA